MKKEIITRICRYAIMIFLPLAILLTILQVYSFNVDFYMDRFDEYNISDITKIDRDDLKTITVNLVDYLKSDRKNLNMEAEINGIVEEVFGEREKNHMVDVKVLFDKGFLLRNLSLGLSLVALVILAVQKNNNDIFKSFLSSGVISLSLFAILLLLMKIDFWKYFTYFHEIFFTNDLWLLNPETDVLIQMLPLEFFISISTRVVTWFIGIMSMIGGISCYRLRNVINRKTI